MAHDRIAVIDFGGQYAHLIATKIRQLHVLAEICPPETSPEQLGAYQGIVLSGSPALISTDKDSPLPEGFWQLQKPMLGLCFGHQQLAHHYGGQVAHTRRQYGPSRLRLTTSSPLFQGLNASLQVWMSHGDSVTALPPGFSQLALSLDPDGTEHPNAAIGHEALQRFGLQFHPEVDDTEGGQQILQNFVLGLCQCRPDWTMDQYLSEQLELIRKQAGQSGVFLLASGGVDSTVCARLIEQALGPEQLHLLHIDNGLMRKDESKQVLQMLRESGIQAPIHFVDASELFLTRLATVSEPEQKRHLIGQTFVEVFEQKARELGLDKLLLGQGTIYPDTIETGGTKRSDVIKTHHNRVPLIQQLIAQGRVIEPLRELYKAEVRQLGEQLGLSASLLWRQPFPGPGLGVRLLCSEGEPPAGPPSESLQPHLDELMAPFGLSAIVLPVRSVGVKGDERCYERPVLLMGKASEETLSIAAAQAYQRVPGINRCLWLLSPERLDSPKPRKAYISPERLALLREADHHVTEALTRYDLLRAVWQCPTVLVPLATGDQGKELLVLRPVHSERAMTARAAFLPPALLSELVPLLAGLSDVGAVALDLTPKPPGTIEWE